MKRFRIWLARRRLQDLCDEANYARGEIDCAQAKLDALGPAITTEFHRIYLMKQQ